MKTLFSIMALLAFYIAPAYAADNKSAPVKIHNSAATSAPNAAPAAVPAPLRMGMVTGPKGGTYISIGQDLARLAEQEGLTLDIKESGGSIDNLRRIASEENAALGIVQSDVLGFLRRSHSADSLRIASNLRMIAPLYAEEIHVLARNQITQFSDLNGKIIAVGEEGSGSMLTAVNLMAIEKIVPKQMLKIAPAQGIVAVLSGQADAAIFVGGKPVKLFENLKLLATSDNQKFPELLRQVHFLPLRSPKLEAEYDKATLSQTDYSFMDKQVPTLAVRAVLVSYDFSTSGKPSLQERCEWIGKFAAAIRKNLPQLQSQGHAKWKQVNLAQELPVWQKDACAWPESTQMGGSLGEELLRVIQQDQAPKP